MEKNRENPMDTWCRRLHDGRVRLCSGILPEPSHSNGGGIYRGKFDGLDGSYCSQPDVYQPQATCHC